MAKVQAWSKGLTIKYICSTPQLCQSVSLKYNIIPTELVSLVTTQQSWTSGHDLLYYRVRTGPPPMEPSTGTIKRTIILEKSQREGVQLESQVRGQSKKADQLYYTISMKQYIQFTNITILLGNLNKCVTLHNAVLDTYD